MAHLAVEFRNMMPNLVQVLTQWLHRAIFRHTDIQQVQDTDHQPLQHMLVNELKFNLHYMEEISLHFMVMVQD